MRSVSSPLAVSITTGTGASAWIRRHTSSPSSPGSIRSSTTRSGGSASAAASPASPSAQTSTIAPLPLQVGGDHLRHVRVVVDDQHALTVEGGHERHPTDAPGRASGRSGPVPHFVRAWAVRSQGPVRAGWTRAPPDRRQAPRPGPGQDPPDPRVRRPEVPPRWPPPPWPTPSTPPGPAGPTGWWWRSTAIPRGIVPPDFEVVPQRPGTFADRLAGAWADAGGAGPADRHGHAAGDRADLDDALDLLDLPGHRCRARPGGRRRVVGDRAARARCADVFDGIPMSRARHRRPPAGPAARARPRHPPAPDPRETSTSPTTWPWSPPWHRAPASPKWRRRAAAAPTGSGGAPQ